MRAVLSLVAIVSEDNDQIERELDINRKIDDTTTTTTTFKRGTFDIAANTPNVEFAFAPQVTNAKYLILHVLTGTVSVKLQTTGAFALTLEPNPASTPDPISPYQKVGQPAMYVVGPITNDEPLTTIFMSNPSATVAARVAVAVVGEAT